MQSLFGGEMLEWLKRHAWKACVPPKGIASSNLALSAKRNKPATSLLDCWFILFCKAPPQAERDSASGRQAAQRNLGESGSTSSTPTFSGL